MQTTALLMITVILLAFAAQSQTTAESSQLVSFELTVTDSARSKSFYGHVLGWTYSDSPSPDFVSIKGAGVAGGILRDPNKKPGNGDVKILFAVQDISATWSVQSKWVRKCCWVKRGFRLPERWRNFAIPTAT